MTAIYNYNFEWNISFEVLYEKLENWKFSLNFHLLYKYTKCLGINDQMNVQKIIQRFFCKILNVLISVIWCQQTFKHVHDHLNRKELFVSPDNW